MSGPSSAPAPSFPRHPDFVRLWTAETVSQLGTQVSALAIPFVAKARLSLRQAVTPARMQGRMNATMRWFVWGTIPIGGVLGGVLGSVLGVRAALLVGIVGETLAVLPVLFSPVRRIRAMPEPVAEESAEEIAEGNAGAAGGAT
jgi:hypothetical protein